MNYKKIAEDILNGVGGSDNVKHVTHCFTRLRFVLKDSTKAEKIKIEHLEGVISIVESGGQFQVVVGTKVTKIYDELVQLLPDSVKEDVSQNDDEDQNDSWGNRIIKAVTEMFTPMVPAIAASGLLKGLLTIARIIAGNYGVDITTNDTYVLIMAATDAIFYFMPLILAYTCAKVFKANKFIAMALGGTMCYPTVVTLMTSKSAVTMFGLAITKANYASTVIPIIIGVFILSYVEKFLDKVIPEILKIIFVPGISLLVMVPATFMIFGPIGIYIGNLISAIYSWMMNVSPALCGAFVGGMWCIFVVFGAHRALLPIGINDVANLGRQNLLAFAGAANFSQGGAALGVMLKTKNKDLKTVAASSSISAALCGITEPAIYGCNLRLKKPMICAVICGAVGGAIMGIGGVYGDAFANNGVLTFATYASFGLRAFIFFLIGNAIAFVGAAVLTYIVGFEDDLPTQTTSNHIEIEENEDMVNEDEYDLMIGSPIQGNVIKLEDVNDEVFSSGAMGKGVAIQPTLGEVVAPEDCTINLIYPTLHAIGLTLDSGVEMIIHVGMDTVQLNGKYFKKHIEEGVHVEKGTKIVSFDIQGIQKEGYDTIVPVVICNTNNYFEVTKTNKKYVNLNENAILIKKEEK